MATDPIFVATPKVGSANISTANTNRTNTGTITTVFTAGSSGSLVRKITFQATATTTAGVVRIWIFDNAGTPNGFLLKEVLVTAITPSTTVAAYNSVTTLYETNSDGLILPASWSIRASTHNAESFNVIVEGADY